MGLTDPKFFIEKNIAEHKKKYHSHYDRFLNDEAPITVTWFKSNADVSTDDIGLENVESTTSKARKYDKVDNLMVYGLDIAEVSLSMSDDKGLSGDNISGEITLLPETIKPNPEDKFIVNHMGNNIIFRVTKVSFPLIKSNNFWLVGYELDDTNGEEDYLSNNIINVYDCIYNNIGTDFKVVVRKDELATLKSLEILKDLYTKNYIELYYQNKTNSFVFEIDSTPNDDEDSDMYPTYLYNKYLHKFVMDNSLFSNLRSFNAVTVTQEVNLRRGFSIDYDKTLYNIIINKDISNLDKTLTDLFIISITNRSGSLFSAFPDNYIQGDIVDGKYRKVEDIEDIIYYQDFIPKELYDSIDDVALTNNELYKIISNYLNNKVMVLSELNFLKNNKFHYTRDNFVLLPFIIYIIKFNINILVSKEVDNTIIS